jgi:septum formation protein
LKGEVYAKPTDRAHALRQLCQLAGKTHELLSAAVIYEDQKPVWRHVGTARLTMHNLSEQELDAYLDKAWPAVQSSVGAYHAEALGAQLFAQISGDWFSVLGLPLLEVLSYLRLRGMLGQ